MKARRRRKIIRNIEFAIMACIGIGMYLLTCGLLALAGVL